MYDEIRQGGKSNSVTINSVGGTVVKSCSDSKFIRFHMESQLAGAFFDGSTPNNGAKGYAYRKVSVLQVMLCGNEQFLVEYLDAD